MTTQPKTANGKAVTGDFKFTGEAAKRAKTIVAKYPKGRQKSALLPLLDLAQRENGGWLSQAALNYVADYLEQPYIRVYEVATFYTMFNLKPVGEQHLQLCKTTPCWLRGSDDLVKVCKDKLGLKHGQTTEDGKFTLTEVECLGACCNAPMVQINDHFYEDLDAESFAKVLDDLQNGKQVTPGSIKGRKGSMAETGKTTLTEAKGKS